MIVVSVDCSSGIAVASLEIDFEIVGDKNLFYLRRHCDTLMSIIVMPGQFLLFINRKKQHPEQTGYSISVVSMQEHKNSAYLNLFAQNPVQAQTKRHHANFRDIPALIIDNLIWYSEEAKIIIRAQLSP